MSTIKYEPIDQINAYLGNDPMDALVRATDECGGLMAGIPGERVARGIARKYGLDERRFVAHYRYVYAHAGTKPKGVCYFPDNAFEFDQAYYHSEPFDIRRWIGSR